MLIKKIEADPDEFYPTFKPKLNRKDTDGDTSFDIE